MPVNVIGTLKPKNNGKFPVAEAVDIKVTDDLRLDKALEDKADLSTVNFALDNKADKTTTQSLQNQINNIIEPVTEDAEVINAREGADGTSYQTLKARLDAENDQNNYAINSLKNNVNDDISEISGEIYVETAGTLEEQTFYTISAPNSAQSNTTYQTRTVSAGTSKKAKITGYIPANATGLAVCLCLNSNYELISSFGNGGATEVSFSDYEIELPNDTAYIRVVTKNSVPAAIKLYQKRLTYNTFNSYKVETSAEISGLDDRLSSAIGSYDTSVVPLTGADIVANEYIGRDGNVKTATGLSRTVPIHLTKGSTISARVAAYVGTFAITVAIFAEYKSNEYIPLVAATDSALTNYTYKATKDMDIVISFKNNDSNTASKTIHTAGSIEPLYDHINPDSCWVCFGDSITGIYTTPCIPDMMSARYGCEVYNVGFPGTRARTRTDTDYQYFDFQALATAIVSGDYTEQEEHLSGVTSIYAERLATLEAIDFSKVTNAYFFYGTNDFNGSQTVQGMKDALLDGISRILAKYPNITPVLITPLFRFKVEGGNVIFLDDDNWTNGADKKLTDYITGVEEVGEENYIPVLNLLETLGITKYNYTKFFDVSDGTHPSEAGIQKIGKSIAAKLEYLNSD